MASIYYERCRYLRAMFSLSRRQFLVEPTAQSVMFGCGECWNDEADDAVQEHVYWSTQPVPGEVAHRVDYAMVNETLRWRANREAIWAFAAMCTEEGWEEDTGLVNGALKNVYLERTSPLLLVQRDGDQLRGTWLGAPLRGWLDLPLSMQDRDAYRDGGGPALMPDVLAAPLVGRERELHEQVLVDPYDRGVRDVLRDLWIERGDPRGDYCTASDPATVDHDRAATLIADHARSWVGALQPVIPLAGALFGYGPWIRSAIVYADRAALDAVADAPEWGSIERIEFAMGSARLVSPRMRNARAIGPLTLDELAPLRTGDWQVRELDVEIADHPLDLATLALPLTVLRLRPPRTRDPLWIELLSGLEAASWWPALERLELWLPGGGSAPAEDALRVFRAAVPQVGGKTLIVGVLDAGQPTGWTLVARAGTRSVEVSKPDLRTELGTELARVADAKAPDLFELDEDWLTFALGVPSRQPI